MPSFLPKHAARRERAVSHGGLGGLLKVEPVYLKEATDRRNELLTWPRKRWKPPPLDIVNGIERTSPELLHCTMSRQQQCCTPTTPSSMLPFSPMYFGNSKSLENSASLPMSPHNAAPPQCVYRSLPVTPLKLAPNITSLPAELAGSLLSPSQGFPQNSPPAIPPRFSAIQRRLTDEGSDISSVPSLSISSCSDSPDAMDLLKTFSSPTKRFARAVESSFSANSTDRNPLSINKPMSSMNVEELLNRLPGLGLNVVNHVWLPAMKSEFTKIKALLQDAAEMKLESHNELKNFGKDLIAISDDARKVSVTYEKALLSTESLIERDTKECYEKLAIAEKNLDAALVANDDNKDAIRHKDQTISGLRQTVEFIVKQLCPLIHENLRQQIEETSDSRFDAVLQIMADHSSSHDHSGNAISPRYLRITEEIYLSDFFKFQAAEMKILQYQELAWDQNKIIKEQSADLDECLRRYERLVNTIKERDHEVLLLVQHNDKCQKQIEDYENGMSVGPSIRAEQERLLRQNNDMHWAIKSMRLAHAKELEDRDAEIANLRQKLGSAREEVLARKADIKNVITHTPALLSPIEGQSEMTLGGYAAKECKMQAKDKARKGHRFPSSMSMTSLPFLASKIDLTAAIEDDRYSDKELLTQVSRLVPQMVPRIEKPEWACGMPNNRSFLNRGRADPSMPDLAPRLRSDPFGPAITEIAHKPRTDSLGVVSSYMRTLNANAPETNSSPPTANTHKELPTPPEIDSNNNPIEIFQTAYQARPHHCPPIPITPQTDFHTLASHKRVLSNIPEVSSSPSSTEDKALSPSLSLTSSDRDAYNKNLDALNLREFMREGDLRIPRVRRRPIPRADYEGWEYGEDDYEGEEAEMGLAKAVQVGTGAGSELGESGERKRSEKVQIEDSPARTVSEMYHSGQRINGR